ncbi:MAG: DUF3501 family protein [Planctomycetes bacterium]|nr:DUF3501 family protein [Planctomycetota bacterium]
MNPLALSDVIPIAEYEKQREKRRKQAMELRNRRRAQLGDKVTLEFENRDTLIYQVQEMMRAEQLQSLDAINEELETYNDLLPRAGELSATLFIQITNDAELRKWLPIFTKLDGNLYLQVGKDKLLAEFEPGRTEENRTAAVHYIKFVLSAAQAKMLRTAPAKFVIDLKDYPAETPVGDNLRKELVSDLT